MGAGALPYAGPAFEALKTAVHNGRHITNRATNISNNAKGHAQDLEKFNARKFAQEAMQEDTGFA
jgi:chromosome condensin MukBEF MukE localization factor